LPGSCRAPLELFGQAARGTDGIDHAGELGVELLHGAGKRGDIAVIAGDADDQERQARAVGYEVQPLALGHPHDALHLGAVLGGNRP
jgi:hypothetical protein